MPVQISLFAILRAIAVIHETDAVRHQFPHLLWGHYLESVPHLQYASYEFVVDFYINIEVAILSVIVRAIGHSHRLAGVYLLGFSEHEDIVLVSAYLDMLWHIAPAGHLLEMTHTHYISEELFIEALWCWQVGCLFHFARFAADTVQGYVVPHIGLLSLGVSQEMPPAVKLLEIMGVKRQFALFLIVGFLAHGYYLPVHDKFIETGQQINIGKHAVEAGAEHLRALMPSVLDIDQVTAVAKEIFQPRHGEKAR